MGVVTITTRFCKRYKQKDPRRPLLPNKQKNTKSQGYVYDSKATIVALKWRIVTLQFYIPQREPQAVRTAALKKLTELTRRVVCLFVEDVLLSAGTASLKNFIESTSGRVTCLFTEDLLLSARTAALKKLTELTSRVVCLFVEDLLLSARTSALKKFTELTSGRVTCLFTEDLPLSARNAALKKFTEFTSRVVCMFVEDLLLSGRTAALKKLTELTSRVVCLFVEDVLLSARINCIFKEIYGIDEPRCVLLSYFCRPALHL